MKQRMTEIKLNEAEMLRNHAVAFISHCDSFASDSSNNWRV